MSMKIEYSGMRSPLDDGWTAHLAIYGDSPNPMHRNCFFPAQRVSVATMFPTMAEAEAEARSVALSMLEPTMHTT